MTDDREITKRMHDWGVPDRAARIVIGGCKPTQAIDFAAQFVGDYDQDRSNILVLAGGVGVGKTIAAAWVMMQVVAPAFNGRFDGFASAGFGVRRFRHVSELIETGLYGGDEGKKERQLIKAARVLVIDDVGTEHMTDTFQTLFDGLINARYEHDGATVITTNLTSETFLSRYGRRIYDRLRGRGQWFDIGHESLRGGA